MKRFSFLILGLAIALVAASGASAKTKARKSNSETIPSVKTIDRLMDKIFKSDNVDRTTTPAGIKLLAKKVLSTDIRCEYIAVGKNVHVLDLKDDSLEAEPNGPHAWYLEYVICGGESMMIFFGSKDDRDAYFEEFKKHSSQFDKKIFESNGTKGYFTEKDGWYGINLMPFP